MRTLIGKRVVRRLLATSTPVTILDMIDPSKELFPLLSPSTWPLLKTFKGDIRNTTLLSEIMTPDIVGVVHLAAVSRVLWCLENEADCWDVNERGTKLILDALSTINAKDNGRRWFILASSREVYGDMPKGRENDLFKEDAEKKPANVYGASKLAAEKTLQSHLESLEAKKARGTLHAVALRLSNVYGSVYDHVERLVPSIATQALSHQIIQISGGQQHVRRSKLLISRCWIVHDSIQHFLTSLTYSISTTVSMDYSSPLNTSPLTSSPLPSQECFRAYPVPTSTRSISLQALPSPCPNSFLLS